MTENTINGEAYTGDIVSRLRSWRGLHLAHGGRLFEEAADEIERLRLEFSLQKSCTVAGRGEIARLREAIRRLADQDATLSVQDGNVTVTMDVTLTDEERQAIERVLDDPDLVLGDTRPVLSSLLERLN